MNWTLKVFSLYSTGRKHSTGISEWVGRKAVCRQRWDCTAKACPSGALNKDSPPISLQAVLVTPGLLLITSCLNVDEAGSHP